MARPFEVLGQTTIALNTTTTYFRTANLQIGRADELHIFIDGNLASSDASTPVATINYWIATVNGWKVGFPQVTNGTTPLDQLTTTHGQYQRLAYSTTWSGAAGGASAYESTDIIIGRFAKASTEIVMLGAIALVEIVMSANATIGSGHIDIQGR